MNSVVVASGQAVPPGSTAFTVDDMFLTVDCGHSVTTCVHCVGAMVKIVLLWRYNYLKGPMMRSELVEEHMVGSSLFSDIFENFMARCIPSSGPERLRDKPFWYILVGALERIKRGVF